MPGLSDFFFGTPETQQQIQNFTPEQIQALTQFRGIGSQGLQRLLGAPSLVSQQRPMPSYEGFEPIEQYTRSQFEKGIPSLAERFTNSGTKLGSSAFAGQLGAANQGLSEYLGNLRANYGLEQQHRAMQHQQYNQGLGFNERSQQMGLLQQLLGYGLQPQFDTRVNQAQEGFLSRLANYAPTAIGAAFGVPLPPLGSQQQMPSQQYSPRMQQLMQGPPSMGTYGRAFESTGSFGRPY